MKTNIHHCIPISIGGNSKPNNLIELDVDVHNELHRTQNINSKYIRKYRDKINKILVPNNYTLNLKQELYNRFFSDIKYAELEQKQSLNLILRDYEIQNGIQHIELDNIEKIIEGIIFNEKLLIEKILGKK